MSSCRKLKLIFFMESEKLVNGFDKEFEIWFTFVQTSPNISWWCKSIQNRFTLTKSNASCFGVKIEHNVANVSKPKLAFKMILFFKDSNFEAKSNNSKLFNGAIDSVVVFGINSPSL